MIRTNKVKIMTRAAIFEKEEERGALHISHFYKGDYVSYGMLKSAISLTCAFGLGVCVWVIYHAEKLMTEESVEDLLALGRQMLVWYGAALAVFLLISFLVYSLRYSNAQRRLKSYRANLRKLMKLYQEEGTAKERTV